MTDADGAMGSPWYRHFWPWLIVALLLASFGAGLLTLWIAFAERDSLVSEHWYAEGERINRRLALEANAARRAIRAELRIDALTGEVRVDLTGDGVAAARELTLRLEHPTLASSDRTVLLRRSVAGSFRGSADAGLAGRWYAQLAPATSGPRAAEASHSEIAEAADWRLTATLSLPSPQPLSLGARE